MTNEEANFIGSMNMCDEISNEAYKKIMCNCEVEEQQPCEEENPNCTECRYYDHEKHHCPRFCKVIENTMAEITSEQARWIPVSERLPEENIHVLCQFYMGGMAECYHTHDYWHIVGGFRIKIDDVLAWMPLPQPYAESEDAE